MSEVRQRERLYCPHCEEKVSKSTYYRHRAEFYDPRTRSWIEPGNQRQRAFHTVDNFPSLLTVDQSESVCDTQSAVQELSSSSSDEEEPSCDDEHRGMEGVIITINTKILVFAITEIRNSLWQLIIILNNLQNVAPKMKVLLALYATNHSLKKLTQRYGNLHGHVKKSNPLL